MDSLYGLALKENVQHPRVEATEDGPQNELCRFEPTQYPLVDLGKSSEIRVLNADFTRDELSKESLPHDELKPTKQNTSAKQKSRPTSAARQRSTKADSRYKSPCASILAKTQRLSVEKPLERVPVQMPLETNPADELLMTDNKLSLQSVTVVIECNASSTEKKSVALASDRSGRLPAKSPHGKQIE